MSEAKQKAVLAEQQAKKLFDAAEKRGLIAAGKTESELAAEIVKLANEEFGIDQFWHKKIVRTGPNTQSIYTGNPANLLIQEGDILFLDFGPIFNGWEADLGRTYVLGNDPLKIKLKNDVEAAWHEAQTWYHQQATLTGAACFKYLTGLATKYGWEYAGEIGGHIVGPYPHEQAGDGNWSLDIHPDNHTNILQKDADGNDRHWILEMHFVDRSKGIGGFFEQLV